MIEQPALATEGANVPCFLVRSGLARADVSAWCEKVIAAVAAACLGRVPVDSVACVYNARAAGHSFL